MWPHVTVDQCLTTEQWKKGWWRIRQQCQWRLLRERKLWDAATSGDLAVHSFSHSAAKLHLGAIHSWIKGSGASGGLAMERVSRCAPKKKHHWEGNNHHFFPCMALHNGVILQQQSFMATGALVNPFQTCIAYCSWNSEQQKTLSARVELQKKKKDQNPWHHVVRYWNHQFPWLRYWMVLLLMSLTLL